MTATSTTSSVTTSSVTARHVRLLLLAGAIAGPLFAVSTLAQAAVRDGFDPLRHAVSQLALGSGGWIQTATFAITGLLAVACAVGLRAVLRGGRGRTWAPILVAVQGLGFIAAALLPAEPGNGFPPGSAPVSTMTVTGALHLACAGTAFLALIAACFVLASRFVRDGERGWAVAGRTAAALLIVGFGAANSGATGGPLAMFVGAVAAWVWVGASAAKMSAWNSARGR